MDWLRAGFILLVAAPAAWLVGVLLIGLTTYILPLVVVLAGTGLAAWAVPTDRRVLALLGMSVAAVGMAVFYQFDLFSNLANRAGGIVLLGLVIGGLAAMAQAPRGVAAGLLVVASGGLLWVYVDGSAVEWQVGNVLLVSGSVLAAIAEWRRG